MKKEYLKPAAEIEEFSSEILMTTTSGEQGSAGTGDGTADDETPDLVGRRRGSWGNLWGED